MGMAPAGDRRARGDSSPTNGAAVLPVSEGDRKYDFSSSVRRRPRPAGHISTHCGILRKWSRRGVGLRQVPGTHAFPVDFDDQSA